MDFNCIIHKTGHIVRPIALFITWLFANLTPKNYKLILFHASSDSTYNGSSRYLYEYFCQKNQFIAVWLTENRTIYNFLSSQNKLVVMKRSMKGLYYFFRAGFIVGTAVSFPTLWKAVGKKTTKIALYHGMGPRSTSSGSDDHEITNGRVFRTTKGIIKDINKWDYFVFTSQYTSSIIGKLQFHLPKAKRIVMGYPRCDHLLNSSFVIRRYNNKEILRQYFPEARSSSKLILYAPTWRITNTDLSFPMNLIKKFDMKHLSEYLKLNGFYMLISMHGRVSSMESFNGYGDRIQYLRRDPLFDINMLLPEVSMLISDYSTIITEFALLDRPIIYIMPDYDYFLYERGLLEDIRDNLAGKEARSMEELVNIIDKYNLNPRADADLRKNYLRKYYDVSIKDSSYRIYEFMDKLKKDKIGLAVTQPNI